MLDVNRDPPIHTLQAQPILESGSEASEMDRANSDGLTVPVIRVTGRIIVRTVLANLLT